MRRRSGTCRRAGATPDLRVGARGVAVQRLTLVALPDVAGGAGAGAQDALPSVADRGRIWRLRENGSGPKHCGDRDEFGHGIIR